MSFDLGGALANIGKGAQDFLNNDVFGFLGLSKKPVIQPNTPLKNSFNPAAGHENTQTAFAIAATATAGGGLAKSRIGAPTNVQNNLVNQGLKSALSSTWSRNSIGAAGKGSILTGLGLTGASSLIMGLGYGGGTNLGFTGAKTFTQGGDDNNQSNDQNFNRADIYEGESENTRIADELSNMQDYLNLQQTQQANNNAALLAELELEKTRIELQNLKDKTAQMSQPVTPTALDVANTNYYNSLADYNSLRAAQLSQEIDFAERASAISGGQPAVMYTPAMADYDLKLFGRPTNTHAGSLIYKPIMSLKDMRSYL